MPSFAYTARDRNGQTVSSTLEAATRKDALRLLTSRGLTPQQLQESAARPAATAIARGQASSRSAATPARANASGTPASRPAAASSSKADAPRARSKSSGASGKITLSRRHRLPFLTALHELTTSGLSAGEALRLLSLRVQEPSLRSLCAGLWERVGEGATLSGAFQSFPAVFDEATINLVQAGEATGNLNDVLGRVNAHLLEQQELQRKLLAALAYPVFLALVAGGVVLFFLFFLLPRLESLFAALRGELPLATKLLISSSKFLLNYGVFIAIGAVLAAVSYWRWYLTELGRAATDESLLKLPLVGPFVVAQSVLAFSQTLCVLLENGITTAEALRMTERQIQNRTHRAAFRSATDRVMEGEALSQALIRTGCFPALVLDQLSIGENTGNLVSSLRKIAVNFQRNVSTQLSFFTQVLGSAVLLTVFTFVGFIAYAIVSAVFELSAQIKM